MINIGVLGTGYVGLVTGACLSSITTNRVTCLDIDETKIEALNNGQVPIYEEGLEKIIRKNVIEHRLYFDSDINTSLDICDVIFIAVGTPSNKDGSVNLDYVKSACESICKYCTGPKWVVMKSTVPVRTHQKVQLWLGTKHTVISNPEFLREGTAVQDFMNADRIIIGTATGCGDAIMSRVYAGYLDKIIWMDNTSAEMVKYASNCLLATRLALWNEIAVLSNYFGANIHSVREGCTADKRIGSRFLLAGPGYGGSCFPKDTRGLRQMFFDAPLSIGTKYGYGDLIDAVIRSNDHHKEYIYYEALGYTGGFRKLNIAILGLAFKSDTDDTRESPTHTLLKLIDEDIKDLPNVVRVCDPAATQLPSLPNQHLWKLEQTTNIIKTLTDADIVFAMTEWPQYRHLDLDYVKSLMRGNIIADARNMWSRSECEKLGFRYIGIGS